MKKTIFALGFIIISYTLVGQNIGFGTNNPHSSAAVHISSSTKGLLIPSMTTAQRNAIPLPAEGLLIYNTTTFEINQRQDGAWKALINNEYWFKGGNQMWNIGYNVGIGTAGPAERLDVSGNIRSNESVIIDNTSALLQLRSIGVNKGFVQLSGDDFRIGTNSGNADGNVVIRMDGTNMLSFQKTAAAGLSMQMNLNGVSAGVLQVTNANNVSLTAVNANAQLQLGGEVFINNTANTTGIGTSSPTERLHVNGKLKVSGTDMTIEDGRITGTTTGLAYNLLPVCYGRINASGTKAGGTPNFTAYKDGGVYVIESASFTASSVISISVAWTGESYSPYSINFRNYGNGKFGILQSDITGNANDNGRPFHFIVYNP